MDVAERIRRFEISLTERLVEKVERFDWGRAFLDPDLPDVWDNNFLLVEASPAPTATGLATAAERVQSQLRHRKVVVPDEQAGRELAPGLSALGYKTTRLVSMELRRAPDRAGDVAAAGPLDLADAEPALRAFYASAPFDDRQGLVIEQLIERARRLESVTDVRRFGVRADGLVASLCDLYLGSDIGQIEDVITLRPHRSRGFARAVVSRAVSEAREAGADLIFLVADLDDWPMELYRRMGFDSVAVSYNFNKPVP